MLTKDKLKTQASNLLIQFDRNVLLYVAAMLLLPILLKQIGLVVVFIVLIARCIRGGANDVLESVVLATVLRYMNPLLLPPGLVVALGSVLVHIVGLLVVFRKVKPGMLSRPSNLMMLVLIGHFFFTSLFVSRYPDVSIFKLIMFTLVWVIVAQGMRLANVRRLEVFLYNLFLFVVMVSVPLLGIPSIGLGSVGLGFSGFFNQPQACAAVFTVFICYYSCFLIYAKEQFKNHKINLLMLPAALACLYKTEARTGMFALILAIGATIVIVMLDRKFPSKRKLRVSKFVLLGGCAAVLLTVFAMNKIQHFVFKTRGKDVTEMTAQGIYGSREGIVGSALYSLNTNPICGIGFGIANSSIYMNITYLPGTQIPISAPVEKGVMLAAVLEEGGVIGLLIILTMFYMMIEERKKINPLYVCTFFPVFFVNFGESMLFTTNGLGPLMLLFLYLQPQKSAWGKLP